MLFILFYSANLFYGLRSVFAVNPSYYDDFNINWTYKKIFGPNDIPLPASANNLNGATVVAVYSPSVIKINNQYFMFFGVSIYCYPERTTVARDSIALAGSSDGINWQFIRYIIEPDPKSCQSPPSQWSEMSYQVNDPSVHINPNNSAEVLVFYTSVIWPQDNYGHIGLAKFNLNLAQTFRNDRYLVGTTILSNFGYSRPDVQWDSSNNGRLWFDSYGKVGSVPIDNFQQLNNPAVRNENINAADINLPRLDDNKPMMLYDGAPSSWAISKDTLMGSWSTPWHITINTGQGWDSSYQGSPELFLDRATCQVKLYFAGAVMGGQYGGYNSLSIGLAIPPPEKKFSFPICTNKTDIFDLRLFLSNYISIFDYNLIVGNFGK